MKQVFISQPMKDKTDVEILRVRAAAAEAAQEYLGEDVTILQSMWERTNIPPVQMLARAIDLMAQADLVYFAVGWETARGCRIEHMCAQEYGIPYIEAV